MKSVMGKVARAWAWCCAVCRTSYGWSKDAAGEVPDILDWFVAVSERLLVLGAAYVVSITVWSLATDPSPTTSRIADLIGFLNTNYRVLVILAIPLAARTLLVLLSETDRFGSWRRRPRNPADNERTNPRGTGGT